MVGRRLPPLNLHLRDLHVFLLHGFVEIPIAPFLVSPVTSPVVTYAPNLHPHPLLILSPPEVSAKDSAAKPASSKIQRTRLIISWLLFIVFVVLLGFGIVVYGESSTHLSGLVMAIIGIIGIGAFGLVAENRPRPSCGQYWASVWRKSW